LGGIGSKVAFEKELKRQEVEVADGTKKHGHLLLSAIISNRNYNPSIFPYFEGQNMVTVEFLGPIGKAPMEIEATSLAELADALKGVEGLDAWLGNSAVAVNDTMVSGIDVSLKDGDKVSILPPVCGG
jgi:molybdopterin synthase sulfur carrier subunit